MDRSGTLLDDYKGRTPEAVPNITRDELTRAIYQEYIKGYYRLVGSVGVGMKVEVADT